MRNNNSSDDYVVSLLAKLLASGLGLLIIISAIMVVPVLIFGEFGIVVGGVIGFLIIPPTMVSRDYEKEDFYRYRMEEERKKHQRGVNEKNI